MQGAFNPGIGGRDVRGERRGSGGEKKVAGKVSGKMRFCFPDAFLKRGAFLWSAFETLLLETGAFCGLLLRCFCSKRRGKRSDFRMLFARTM